MEEYVFDSEYWFFVPRRDIWDIWIKIIKDLEKDDEGEEED